MRLLLSGLLLATSLLAQNAAETRVGTFRGRPVVYQVVDGWGIAEGDIILGRAQDLEAAETSSDNGPERRASARNAPYLWPDRTIPYVVDSDIGSPARVTGAVQHWNDKSVLRLVPRTAEANYVRFRRDPGTTGTCSSSVGMVGGEQIIRTEDSCNTGALIHEIGHAAGLWHEQSRIDRDRWVAIQWDNIDPRYAYNFNQSINGSSDIGWYDFSSIMHYGVTGFVLTPTARSIETIPPGIPVGQRTGLSAGDLDALARLYGTAGGTTVIDTFPAGLNIVVDGESYQAPQSFTWAPGSTHTVEAAPRAEGVSSRYRFARWNDDGERSHTVTASADATFFLAAYTREIFIPTGAFPPGSGSVAADPPSQDGYYPDGATVRFTATPAAGYFFRSWLSVPRGVHGLADNPALTRITSTFDYTATFSTTPSNVVVDSTPPHLQVTLEGSGHTALFAWPYAAGSSRTLSVTSPQLGASGASRYVFTGWSDGGDQSHAVAAPASPTTWTAAFRTEYVLTVARDGNGTVDLTPAADSGFYETGTTVQLVPRPAPGYTFVNWTGALTGTEPVRTLTMDSAKLATALFRGPRSTPLNGTVNAATQQQIGYLAPGELIVVNGTHGAPDDLAAVAEAGADGRLPTVLGGVRLLVDGTPAPLLAVKGNQLTVMVPMSVASKAAVPVQIEYNGRNSTYYTIEVVDAVPGIYTADGSGSGAARVTNEDGAANAPDTPAARGSVISFLATGLGKVNPPAGDNFVVTAEEPPVPALPVRVTVGGAEAEVVSATAIKGQAAGLVQVRARVPDGSQSGPLRLQIYAGPFVARQTVTVEVR